MNQAKCRDDQCIPILKESANLIFKITEVERIDNVFGPARG